MILQNGFFLRGNHFRFKYFIQNLKYQPLYFFSSKPETENPRNIIEKISKEDLQKNKRFDKFIQQKFGLNWNVTQTMFRHKKILIVSEDNKVISREPSYQIKEGDLIKYPRNILPQSKGNEHEITNSKPSHNNNIQLSNFFREMIMYENDDFIIINKLPNISSQGGAEVKLNLPDLSNNYLSCTRNKNFDPESVMSRIVHRLDKYTTGVMAIAKTKLFAQEFSQMLKTNDDITKYYIGVTEGLPNTISSQIRNLSKLTKLDNKGLVNAELLYDQQAMKSKLNNEYVGPKNTITEFEILGIFKWNYDDPNKVHSDFLGFNDVHNKDKIIQFFQDNEKKSKKVLYQTIIKFKIEGGKKHQIRAHSSLVLGTPILMDEKYGYNSDFNFHDYLISKTDLGNLKMDNTCSINHKNFVQKMTHDHKNDLQEIEKHYVKALVNKDFIFLHSYKLEFNLQGVHHQFQAGFPPHFDLFFKHVELSL